jgi:hypothetical protein
MILNFTGCALISGAILALVTSKPPLMSVGLAVLAVVAAVIA